MLTQEAGYATLSQLYPAMTAEHKSFLVLFFQKRTALLPETSCNSTSVVLR
jgi:hypothetical protein